MTSHNTTPKVRTTLPDNVKPTEYHLTFIPNLKDFSFSGEELVKLNILKPNVKEITLNAIDLKVTDVNLIGPDGVWRRSLPANYNSTAQTITFTWESTLPQGLSTLSFSFTGELNTSLKGFYRSKYNNTKGEETYMAVTQFEPTDARRAFPCWDEPNIKATFTVTLVVPKDKVALSNMPVVTDQEYYKDKSLREVKFAESPIMSTYLLALIVGDFDYLEDKTSSGVTIRVYTPVGKKEQGRFALQVAVKTLPFYDNWFGEPFPLPKCDLVAIPDFAAGAMENWGCVTYRETALLVDPVQSSASTRLWVALVVGHELAHMWFGNLVTMEWWTHLWLNEGFASWIEYLCVDYCFPEWDIWTHFVYSDLNRALKLDALRSTHPVEVEVYDPSEIDEIFDVISYSKGSSIIRMLNGWIGEENMKKGLNIYLNKHKFSNALTEDLWDSLEKGRGSSSAEGTQESVKQLMEHWTKQEGYPVLIVEEQKGEKGSGVRKFKITQERFFAKGAEEGKGDKTLWWVPVSILTADGKTVKQVVKDRETVITVPGESGQWVKFNPGQTGFYIVQYSKQLIEDLEVPLSKGGGVLSASDRIGIIGDAFALARAGRISTVQVLDLLRKGYVNEENLTVWQDLSANLGELENVIIGGHKNSEQILKKWNAFVRELYGTIGGKVGWKAAESEPDSRGMLRALVLSRLGSSGDEATIAEAKKKLGQSADIPADLRGVVYRVCAQSESSGESLWENILQIYHSTDMQEEKDRCARSLGWSNNKTKLEKTMDWAFSSGEVRSQDTVFVLGTVSANPVGRDMAWEWTKKNWDALSDKFAGQFLLSRLVQTSSGYFATEERAVEVDNFFGQKKIASAERAVKQAVEGIRSNAGWWKRDGEEVVRWLNEKF